MDRSYANGREVLCDAAKYSINKHTHVVFSLNDGRELHYNDTRKFGKMYLYEKQETIEEYLCLKKKLAMMFLMKD